MKPMSPLEQECAEGLAFALAYALCTSIPSLFGDPPETVLSFTLPVACSLVRAEAKAVRSKKAAKKYRRIRREVRELLRTEPDRLAARPVLANTIPFDPEVSSGARSLREAYLRETDPRAQQILRDVLNGNGRR